MDKSGYEGESGAIYCRISHVKDEDQTGVDRQERICREMAAAMGVRVDPRHVFVDNSRSAWKRDRKRPGWDELLKAVDGGEVKHLLTYHPDRLMRQPWDLEELLRKADDHKLMLHGQANRKDLSNADDRFILRIEVAHACRSSDDTARRVRDAQKDALTAGKAHGGRRAYGYAPDMSATVEAEAEIVREMFRRFLDGDAIHAIAMDLNSRGIPTATGLSAWTAGRVRQLLDSPRHAGLILFQDQVQTDAETGAYRLGSWPAIVSAGEWTEVKRLRDRRSIDHTDARRNYRFYSLRGMVLCTGCGRRMVGSVTNGRPYYLCTWQSSPTPQRCKRKVTANKLEDFVADAAKDFLTNLTTSSLTASPVTATGQDAEDADKDDRIKLEELRQMWDTDEITTDEFRAMQAPIKKRMSARQRATVVRPLTALEGIVIGPGAGPAFDKLTDERKAGVLRFLFPAVRVGATAVRGTFDYGRIKIDPPEL